MMLLTVFLLVILNEQKSKQENNFKPSILLHFLAKFSPLSKYKIV